MLQTISQHLKKVNKDELIKTYLQKYPPNFEDEPNKTYQDAYNKIDKYIDYLISLTPTKSDFVWFAIQYIGEDGFAQCMTLTYKFNELKTMNPTSYGMSFTPQREIMGQFVSDNALTEYNLIESLADILYEASWNGYDATSDKVLEEKTNEILKREYNENDLISWDELKKQLNIPRHFPDDLNDEMEELEHKIWKLQTKFTDKSLEKELKEFLLRHPKYA